MVMMIVPTTTTTTISRSIRCFAIMMIVAAVLCGSTTTSTTTIMVTAFTTAVPTLKQDRTVTTIAVVDRITGSSSSRSRSQLFLSSPSSPQSNDRPELPTIPGDFDWDSKYANDSDWTLMGDAVPGKRMMNELELASQITSLGGLEEKWRKERLAQEYNDAIQIGWVYKAEVTNGRFAMFFLITGLLTEYWTGISLPGQVEEMLRISGVIGM